jgi:hypothetical protein
MKNVLSKFRQTNMKTSSIVWAGMLDRKIEELLSENGSTERSDACGTSRDFAAAQQFSRFRSEAYIQRAALMNSDFLFRALVLPSCF